MEELPAITFDAFMKAHLRPIDSGVLSKVMDALEPQGLLLSELESESLLPGLENGTPLASYFNLVLETYRSVTSTPYDLEPKIQFYSNPQTALISETHCGNLSPAIYALLSSTRTAVGSTTGHHICDAICLGEYKTNKTSRDIEDNVMKIVGSSSQILHSDPSRNFTFGLTVEGTDFHVWFFSRSNVLVTEIKDLNKDRKHLVSFIIALGSATLEELGFDTTVSRNVVDGLLQYVYRINDKKYETVRRLNTFDPTPYLVTRATRVWVVRPLGDRSGIEYVLKDSWIAEDNAEFEIHQSIRDSLKNDVSSFEEHFVKIVEGIIVPTSALYSKEYSMEFVPLQYPDLSPTSSNTSKLNKKRKHCRILYEGVGESLDILNLRNHKAASKCVSQAIEGLKLMYRAGWVHRDISVGNLVAFKQKNGEYTCKIIDLEFGKKYEYYPSGHPEPQTGTPFFMACETQAHFYLYRSPTATRRLDNTNFCGNFLHDMESVWWILVYLLFSTFPAARPIDKNSDQATHYANIFSPFSKGSPDRRDFLVVTDYREHCVRGLPKEFRSEAMALSDLGLKLSLHYGRLEALASFPDSYEAFASIYDLTTSFKEASLLAYDGATVPLSTADKSPPSLAKIQEN